MTYRLSIKIEALRRELAMRRRVYPRLVQNKRMTLLQMNHEIDVMADILRDYERRLAEETPTLFDAQ